MSISASFYIHHIFIYDVNVTSFLVLGNLGVYLAQSLFNLDQIYIVLYHSHSQNFK